MRTLVTGGIRSGKSAYAEGLLAGSDVTYVATASGHRDDPDWLRRIAAHQARRSVAWTTVETDDVAPALDAAAAADRAVLLDDVGHWLTRTLDALHAWEPEPGLDWRPDFKESTDALVAAVSRFAGELVIVTGEVGYGLVSPYASGRLFTDELGSLNQRLAQVADTVVLVVCGCPLVLKGTPVTL